MPLKYLVPNAFTAMSMVIGLASMVCSAAGDLSLAAWMILWGVLLDKLDGGAARLLNASSSFGAEMDSFADFVSFGMAPAALVYFRFTGDGMFADHDLLLGTVCALYVVAASVRLARFNVTEPPGAKNMFFGIPSTLCGALAASGYLSAEIYLPASPLWNAMPVALFAMAILMVSNVRLPKLQKRRNLAVNSLQIINLMAVYIVTPMMLFPEYLFALSLGYLLIGVCWTWSHPVNDDEAPLEKPTAAS